jgi:hypothetical protein
MRNAPTPETASCDLIFRTFQNLRDWDWNRPTSPNYSRGMQLFLKFGLPHIKWLNTYSSCMVAIVNCV